MKTLQFRQLSRMEVTMLQRRFLESSQHGDTSEFRAFHNYIQVVTRVEMPLGEMANPHLEGFFWGWVMSGRPVTTGALPQHHQYAAQGIEGMISIERVTLSQALLVANETGPFRIGIFVPRTFSVREASTIELKGSHRSESSTSQERKPG